MRSAHNSAWHGVRALQGLAVAIRDYHYPPFKEEEFEVWRNEVTCPQSQRGRTAIQTQVYLTPQPVL